jgi:hypothetical protein
MVYYNITQVIKSHWEGHLACNGELVNVYRVLVLNEKREKPSALWKTVLKLILKDLK